MGRQSQVLAEGIFLKAVHKPLNGQILTKAYVKHTSYCKRGN